MGVRICDDFQSIWDSTSDYFWGLPSAQTIKSHCNAGAPVPSSGWRSLEKERLPLQYSGPEGRLHMDCIIPWDVNSHLVYHFYVKVSVETFLMLPFLSLQAKTKTLCVCLVQCNSTLLMGRVGIVVLLSLPMWGPIFICIFLIECIYYVI